MFLIVLIVYNDFNQRRGESGDGESYDDDEDESPETDDPESTTRSSDENTRETTSQATTTSQTTMTTFNRPITLYTIPSLGGIVEGSSGSRVRGVLSAASGVTGIPRPNNDVTIIPRDTGADTGVFGSGNGGTGVNKPMEDNDAVWFDSNVEVFFGFNYNRAC